MFYIIKSESKIIQNWMVNKLIKDRGITRDNVHHFDYEENEFEKSFLEYQSINAFEDKRKVVVLKNANFLNEASPKKDVEEKFCKYYENNDNKNIFVFTISEQKKTGKIFKKFGSTLNVLFADLPKGENLNTYIKERLNKLGFSIDYNQTKRISSLVGDNFDLVIAELKKIIIYDKADITNDLIDNLITDFSKESIFKLSEFILQKDVKSIEKLMQKLKSQGEQFYIIAERLCVEFSKATKYKLLVEKGFNNSQISNMTKWNYWTMNKFSRNINNWRSYKEMEDFLYNVIISKGFLDIIDSNSEQPLYSLEKVLISNLQKIK